MECPICIDCIEEDDHIILPCCKLDLHKSCHDHFIETRYNTKCMHCRREYVPEVFYDAEEEVIEKEEPVILNYNGNLLRIMGGMGGFAFSS